MKIQSKPKTKIHASNPPSINRRRALERELNRWLPLLIESLQPKKILLFGSLTSQGLKEWSDVDLVIIHQTKLPFLERTKQALKLIRPKVGVDLMIYTPEEFSRLTRERRFFRDEIMAKGKVLYARS